MENTITSYTGMAGGEPASQCDPRIAPGSGSQDHSSTNPDPAAESLGEEFEHVERPPHAGDDIQLGLSVVPDTFRNGSVQSGSSFPTDKFAPVVEQGKESEELTGFHSENAIPSGLCSPQHKDQILLLTFPGTGAPDKSVATQYDPFTEQINERNVAGLNPSRSTSQLAPDGSLPEQIYPNFVIFGETGVGKSSVINLIADQTFADTSNDALGCTFQHKEHVVKLGETSYALWDTTGLDEGSEGTVPAEMAERNLRVLIGGLERSGGIHLVMYCIRGSRLTKALKRNYDLFYVTVCQRKVPVALIVTGLEHQPDEMETWWTTNAAALQRYGMHFDKHACVTTLNVRDPAIEQRRSHSRELLRKLMVEYSKRPPWRTDPSLMSRVLPKFRDYFRGTSSMAGLRNTTRKVIVCGSFTEPSSGDAVRLHKDTERIGSRRYTFVQMDKHTFLLPPRMMQDTRNINAEMLIFYTSAPLVNGRMGLSDEAALKAFYNTNGGEFCPVVVVLFGCDDVTECKNELSTRHGTIRGHLTSLPSTPENARAALDAIIKDLYDDSELVDVKETKNSGPFEWLKDVGKHILALLS